VINDEHAQNLAHAVKSKAATTRITGCGGKIVHVKQRGCRIPVHAIVNTRVAILRLCDFAARPHHAVSPGKSLADRIPHGNREAF
jgi:hypothetical protein